MYRTVLVPLDGSDWAEGALAALREAVWDRSAVSVVLLQVVRPPLAATVVPGGGTPAVVPLASRLDEALEAAEDSAIHYLDEVREQLRAEGFEHVVVRVLDGMPEQRIVEAASECDLVVLATSGQAGLARALRGSVADFVVRNTPHSAVLVVRPAA